MKIKGIRATVQEMAKADILDMISPANLIRIKATDSDPLIRVYAVGHEGESKGRVIGVGEVVKKWTRQVIEKLGTMIENGVGLYRGHEQTNDAEGRRLLGQVVGSKVVEEDGKSKALIAAWFPQDKKEEVADLDLCSLETEIDFKINGNEVEIVDVLPVSGIALGSSSEGMVPGFPESGLVASLQMFHTAEIQEEKMDREAIKKAIIDLGLTPSDLFAKSDILAVDYVASLKAEHDAEGYQARKKAEDKLGERDVQIKALNDEIEGLKKDVVPKADHDKIVLENVKFKSRPTITKIAEELKLSEKEKAFLDSRVDSFDPATSDEEEIKTKAKEFVEAQKAEFAKVASIIDPEFKPGEIDVPSSDGVGGGEKNPFLPDPIKPVAEKGA